MTTSDKKQSGDKHGGDRTWTMTGPDLAEVLRATREPFLGVLESQGLSTQYLCQSAFIIDQYARFCEQQEPAHPWLLRGRYLESRGAMRGNHAFSRSYLDSHSGQLRAFLRWYLAQLRQAHVRWGELSAEQLDAYWSSQPCALPWRGGIVRRHIGSLLQWLGKQPPLRNNAQVEPWIGAYLEARRFDMRGNGYGVVLTHRAGIVTRRHLLWLEQQGKLPAGSCEAGIRSGDAASRQVPRGDGARLLQDYIAARVAPDLPPLLRQPLLDYLEHLVSDRRLADKSVRASLQANLALCRKLAEEGKTSWVQLRVPQLDQVVTSLVGAAQHDMLHRRQQVRVHHSRLRGLLRYLHQRGLLDRDLAPALISPPCYRDSTPPTVLSEQQVQRLLESIDRRHSRGRRCHAAVSLMTTYGLVPMDVAELELEQLRWREQRIELVQPQLYTEQELAAIDHAAQAGIRNARSEAHRFAALTRHAALCLLRDCGLRIFEVCNLRLDHYAGAARTARIERTKFFKTRLIPLPRSLCLLLDRYLEHRRQWLLPRGESPMLFVSTTGLPLGRVALEHWHKQLLVDAGLFRPRQRKGATVFGSTNVHALRHSFAVRTLERWQRGNRNVEHLLPLLSAYMGHVKVTYTAHYMHLTPFLMQLASERFGKLAACHLDGGIQGADDDT